MCAPTLGNGGRFEPTVVSGLQGRKRGKKKKASVRMVKGPAIPEEN